MPFQKFSNEESLRKNCPPGLKRINIASLTDSIDLKGKFIQASMYKRFPLIGLKVPSIKFILQDYSNTYITFHGFGDIATSLDSCSVGDTLVLLEFEVETAPKQSRLSTKFQLLADDRNHVKPIVWAFGQDTKYDYTSLNDLKIGTKVNVYGVVSHVKKQTQTRSSDGFLMMNVRDQSLPDRDSVLTCNLFHSDPEKLPSKAQVGDVIRFHRLKIQSYHNKIQATSGPGCHWLLFQGSADNYISSSSKFTIENQDRIKVQELFDWAQSDPLLSKDANDDWTILDAAELSPPSPSLNISSTSSSNMVCLPSTSGTDAKDLPSTSRTDDTALPSTSRIDDKALPSTSRIDDKALPSTSRIDDKASTPSPGKDDRAYQVLNEVKIDTFVNVFGVVAHKKPVYRTKLFQFHVMLNLVDPSLPHKDEKLTCNLFHVDEDKLPCNAEVGDIIRLKQLKIQTFGGKKQGSGNPAWALFRDSCDHPFASSDDFSPNVQEKILVTYLQKWWQERPDSISFSQCLQRQYCNIVCQVIGVYFEEKVFCRTVRVWDGTSFEGPIKRSTNEEMPNGMKMDKSLAEIAGHLAIDVFLFDNHAHDSHFIQPGDVIKLTNLHANIVSGITEMTLHGGGRAYNRGVTKLDQDNHQAKRLFEILKPFQDDGSSSKFNQKGSRKRSLEESSHGDPPPSESKYRKKRNENDNNNRNSADSFNLNSSMDVELALAKEYDNLPPGTDLSQCDKLALEAFMKKHRTLIDNSFSSQEASGHSGTGRLCSVTPNKNRETVDKVVSDEKGSNHGGENRNDSDSSEEDSPSILLSVYNSPSAKDIGTVNEENENDNEAVLNTPSSSGTKVTESAFRNTNSADSPVKPSEGHVTLSQGTAKGSPNKASRDPDEYNSSSQDTFVTASEYVSPERNVRLQPREQESQNSVGSLPSSIRLSLRSTKHSSKNKSQLSLKKKADSQQINERDDAISSSLDGQSKNKDNIEDYFDSEISSSTQSNSYDAVDEEEPLQCMLQAATAVLNHPNVKRSKLKEVFSHKVPYKFRILVRMVDYHPRSASAKDLVKFACFDCKYMCKASADDHDFDSLEGDRFCPNCVDNSTKMQPVIVMKFLFSDGKYDLICHLWKSNAVQFFKGIEPLELLKNEDYFTEVQQYLDKLCPPNTVFKDKPYVECCIFSYHVKGIVHYQIFDTAVV